MRLIRCELYVRCGQSIGRFLFVNLDNFQECGLYDQKYGILKSIHRITI
jgi:hypothetical protein